MWPSARGAVITLTPEHMEAARLQENSLLARAMMLVHTQTRTPSLNCGALETDWLRPLQTERAALSTQQLAELAATRATSLFWRLEDACDGRLQTFLSLSLDSATEQQVPNATPAPSQRTCFGCTL